MVRPRLQAGVRVKPERDAGDAHAGGVSGDHVVLTVAHVHAVGRVERRDLGHGEDRLRSRLAAGHLVAADREVEVVSDTEPREVEVEPLPGLRRRDTERYPHRLAAR